MERRFRLRIFLIAILAMLLTFTMSMLLFFHAMELQSKTYLQRVASLVRLNYTTLKDYSLLDVAQDMHITIVAEDGSILWDSVFNSPKLQNYGKQPEFQQALETGKGESTRVSPQTKQMSYYYAVLLEDGNVLSVSIPSSAVSSIMADALLATACIFVLLFLLSTLSSSMIVDRFVQSVAHSLDTKQPEAPELKPVLAALENEINQRFLADAMRQEFTANVSHELKTPLTSISGYAEMIERGIAREEDVKNFAAKIHSEAQRLIALIQDIIQLSKLDAESEVRMDDVIDLFDVSSMTIEALAFVSEQKHVHLSLSGDHATIHGNLSLIEALIYNLLDNAIRYNKQEGNASIFIEKKEDGCVRLTIADTGIGIPKEDQSRIFERFYRVDQSHSKQTGGTGLGLAIVKHILKCHHATIFLASEENQGTTITITFPPPDIMLS